MNIKQYVLALFLMSLTVTHPTFANVVYSVTLDTTAIKNNGVFGLAFSFQDGSSPADNNNSVTLSQFAFGGGNVLSIPAPILNGNATGDLGSSVTLNDSIDFSSLFVQSFNPGDSLSFLVNATNNIDASGTPDLFGFGLIDPNGDAVLTLDNEFDANNLLYLSFDSQTPTVITFAGAQGTGLSAPIARLSSVPPPNVPEPAILLLVGVGIVGLASIRQYSEMTASF